MEPAERPSAARPGELPPDGLATVGGVDLAAGSRAGERLWRTDEPPKHVEATWLALAGAFADTGLWPVAVEAQPLGLRLAVAGDWAQQAARDPEEVLRALWAEAVGDNDAAELAELLEPVGATWPGLFHGGAGRIPKAVPGTLGAIEGVDALALVAVERPADAVAAIGWQGAIDHTSDVASLSAVLRSWEERYDAILVGLGFDTLYVAVRRPPRGEEACLATAAELYAFCPALIEQGTETLRALAEQLDGSEGWAFWWD